MEVSRLATTETKVKIFEADSRGKSYCPKLTKEAERIIAECGLVEALEMINGRITYFGIEASKDLFTDNRTVSFSERNAAVGMRQDLIDLVVCIDLHENNPRYNNIDRAEVRVIALGIAEYLHCCEPLFQYSVNTEQHDVVLFYPCENNTEDLTAVLTAFSRFTHKFEEALKKYQKAKNYEKIERGKEILRQADLPLTPFIRSKLSNLDF